MSSCKKKSDILTEEEWTKINHATLTFNAKDCPNAIREKKDCDKKIEFSNDFKLGDIGGITYEFKYYVVNESEAILYADEYIYKKNFHYKFILKYSGKWFTGHYVGKYECYFNGNFNSSGNFRIYVWSWN
ncbi:MAG: hypothetical protein N2449_00095 [Bacteroidales bacterium]|nr:hypothetical protein [Bacteroidales bacterium]